MCCGQGYTTNVPWLLHVYLMMFLQTVSAVRLALLPVLCFSFACHFDHHMILFGQSCEGTVSLQDQGVHL